MAGKPRTRRDRIFSLCAWGLVLALGITDVVRFHGAVRFLTLLQIAVSLMWLLKEITGLMREPL